MGKIKLVSTKTGSITADCRLREEWNALIGSFYETSLKLFPTEELTFHNKSDVDKFLSDVDDLLKVTREKASKVLRVKTEKHFKPGDDCKDKESNDFHVTFYVVIRSGYFKEGFQHEIKIHMTPCSSGK